jgi:hypothetical protein
MAHVYVVTSSTYVLGVPGPDPLVTVVGSVDGIPVTVQVWLSALAAALAQGGVAAVKNYIAPIMLAQSVSNSPPVQVTPTQLPTGTFTQ